MLNDLLGFEKMLTPVIIRIVYFLGLAGILIAAVFSIISGKIIAGILMLVGGVIGVRIYCELLILLFRIYEKLVSINEQMKNRT